jgi:hypothetical protein
VQLPIRVECPGWVAHARLGTSLARTDGGEQPKLTITVPSPICRTGRVYCREVCSPPRCWAEGQTRLLDLTQ